MSPSALIDEIPDGLDGLVMELLQLDPKLRPVSAAEVGERLRVIAGLEADSHPATAQAYLITPTLMGRDDELSRVHRRLQRLGTGGRGGTMTLHGRNGCGRSRLLDACVLQAKLDGHTVLRVSGDDVADMGHDAARALAEQLVAVAPAAALEAAEEDWDVLSRLLPALAAEAGQRDSGHIDAETDLCLRRHDPPARLHQPERPRAPWRHRRGRATGSTGNGAVEADVAPS